MKPIDQYESRWVRRSLMVPACFFLAIIFAIVVILYGFTSAFGFTRDEAPRFLKLISDTWKK